MATNAATFTQRKRGVLIGRRLRAVAIVVLLGSIVVIGGHLPKGHDVSAQAADVGGAPASMATDADYFPSHFAPPKGEPEAQPATF
ncbi:MAG TPA: hypothetical protein VGN65_09095 [Casimicrobiaceae bacterium]|jgi:hypothetical protein